ncbi:hypothetical protein ACG2LH_17100 [Zhouia sp. PK063]|uniref:hypothetical protein n=1 Tax=Zhouia sp. PK063 TaxID=3373602 RepID=UPI0037AC0665
MNILKELLYNKWLPSFFKKKASTTTTTYKIEMEYHKRLEPIISKYMANKRQLKTPFHYHQEVVSTT